MSIVEFITQIAMWSGACIMLLGSLLLIIIIAFFLLETCGDLVRRWKEM